MTPSRANWAMAEINITIKPVREFYLLGSYQQLKKKIKHRIEKKKKKNVSNKDSFAKCV